MSDPFDFYRHPDLDTLPKSRMPAPVETEVPSLGALYDAGKRAQLDRNSNADVMRLRDAYAPVLEVLNEGRPSGLYLNPDAHPERAFLDPTIGTPETRAREEARIWAHVATLPAARRKALGLDDDIDAFHRRVSDAAVARASRAAAVSVRGEGIAGTVAEFAGGVVAGFQDPLTWLTMPVGGLGRSAAMRIGTEMLAQSGVAAVAMPITAKRAAEVGQPMTARDMAADIAIAGVGGAAFQGAGEAAVAGMRRLATPAGRMAARMRAAVPWEKMTGAERGAVRTLERADAIAATSPFEPGPGTDAHVARIDATVAALATGPRGEAARMAGLTAAARPVGAPDPFQNMRTEPAARAAPADAFDYNTYSTRLAKKESGGQWDRQAATSTAYGYYQIIKSTFVAAIRATDQPGPGSFARLSDDSIWEKRTNTAMQDRAFRQITRQNEAALARIGARKTYGNMYLMHFAGEGGAAKILKADPDTPVAQLLGADAVRANPRVLKDKTAGDVIEWAHRLMNDSAPTGPVLRRSQFDEDAAGDAAWAAAQREVDEAEAALARADRDAAMRRPGDEEAEAAPAMAEAFDDDVPFDLDDAPRSINFGRDPFAEMDDPPAVRGVLQGENGQPIAFYHGADTVIDQWRIDQGRTGVISVSTDPDFARDYGAIVNKVNLAQGRYGDFRNEADVAAVIAANEKAFADYENGWGAHVARNWSPEQRAAERARFVGEADIRRGDWHRWEQPELWRTLGWDGAYMRETEGMHRADTINLAVADPDKIVAPKDDMPIARPIEGFDDPDDVAAVRQSESMEHDLRMALADDPNLTVRFGDEGKEVRLADAIAEIDGDEAAWAAAQACMTPGTGA